MNMLNMLMASGGFWNIWPVVKIIALIVMGSYIGYRIKKKKDKVYLKEVEEIESDKYNLSKILYIKTKQDFNDMHYVTVLKVK